MEELGHSSLHCRDLGDEWSDGPALPRGTVALCTPGPHLLSPAWIILIWAESKPSSWVSGGPGRKTDQVAVDFQLGWVSAR